jgi:hypothetical protein
MFRWRISIFGKTPASSLGTVTAPDEVTAKQRAVEFFSIPASQQFRVVAVKLAEAKKVKATVKS